jgi:hypothetical protein
MKILACAVLLALVIPATAGAADRGTTTLDLSLKGVRAAAVWPAALSRTGALTLPVTSVTGQTVRHAGGVRLSRGERRLTLTQIRLRLAGDASLVTAVIGGRRTTVFVLRGTALHVTAKAATKLRSALGAKVRGRVGRATMRLSSVTATAPSTSAPAPAPAAAAPPAATPPASDPAPPPPGEVPVSGDGTRWISSGLPADQDHKSWINYVTSPAWLNSGTVTPSDGAARIAADNKYDYTLTPTTVSRTLGAATLNHTGKLAYKLTLHSIDQSIQNLTFVIPALGSTGQVIADGQSNDRDLIGAPPVPFVRTHVLDLQLSGIVPAIGADGDVTYTNVPAVIAEGAEDEVGYAAGRPWGSFTFTIPGSSAGRAAAGR